MRPLLMHRDRDFDPEEPLVAHAQALTKDLELATLFDAMARGDDFLRKVAQRVVLTGLDDPQAIRYRQAVLDDCLRNPAVVREIYAITVESIETKKRQWLGVFSGYPSAILSGALRMLRMFVGLLRRMRNIVDEQADAFVSEGFSAFFASIRSELDDEFFDNAKHHLNELKFSRGVLLSVQLGLGSEGANYALREVHNDRFAWIRRLFTRINSAHSFRISQRDHYGARALGELKDTGINLVANAVAQSADHIDSFMGMLRLELAFYVGCLNLYEELTRLGEVVSLPEPVSADQSRFTVEGLYDACLALTMGRKVVSNDVRGDGRDLVIITGANQGGKSTFLRSVGQAQLMMQCGMFVPATAFCGNLCAGIFTHYRREEDTKMVSGKLDEELGRMSEIVDRVGPNSMILFNESFAATNEREGSEIARQITQALLEKKIKIFFVTHLYSFAHRCQAMSLGETLFLRAERQADGTRTFKLVEGEPKQTSYGGDLYREIFNREDDESSSETGIADARTDDPRDRPARAAASA